MTPVFKTYFCRIGSYSEQPYVASSSGKAKSECLNDARDWHPDLKFTDIRARCSGKLITDSGFAHNAKYRDIEFAHIGMRVIVTGCGSGTIVGHNSSANLNVIFDDRPNLTLNCHPHWEIAYLDANGGIIRDYRKKPNPAEAPHA